MYYHDDNMGAWQCQKTSDGIMVNEIGLFEDSIVRSNESLSTQRGVDSNSKALINEKKVSQGTSTRMDTLRSPAFKDTNTDN